MPLYTAPLRDMRFVLFELLRVQDELPQMPRYADLDVETIDAVLEEAAKFAQSVTHPLNRVGDIEGCTWHGDGVVTAPAGFADAYRQWVDAGWPSLGCDPEFGGQGLPTIVNNRLYEMMNSANQAWLMYSGLSHSAYECLLAYGTPEQKQVYLTKIVSGQWTGTMCLTEPHCGTDLGLLKTRAEPNADGSYALSGTKIFISAGEHDMAENILHLVLARLPDAPSGTKGISLFLVPKFLPDAGGAVGERNGIRAGSIEHKMGIHGNATCVMNLDGATGWLIGEANKGLAAMFVMMNSARLGVGMQSLGLAEAAHQNATAYAKDRLQGRAPSGPQDQAKPADPIIVHPDVRRMLLTSRAYTEGGRAFTTWTALLIDREHAHPDAGVREEASELMALLTPVVKAFITDNAFDTINQCLQVFGGHGYIAEWGVEQYARDARINIIYEGTNGIQALDLLGRKVLMDGGAKFGRFAALIEAFLAQDAARPDMVDFSVPLAELLRDISVLTRELGVRAKSDPNEIGAASVPYLRLMGHLVYAWLWARMARVALDAPGDDAFHRAKLATARFYFARLLPETAMQLRAARAGAATLMAMDAAMF
jgi:alkylation response protein AidB-like acyl-CoA dehydrogenase